jgi:hypothetical protein
MIQSLLIANRGEIACRIIRKQILSGTGRRPSRAEGAPPSVLRTATSPSKLWEDFGR